VSQSSEYFGRWVFWHLDIQSKSIYHPQKSNCLDKKQHGAPQQTPWFEVSFMSVAQAVWDELSVKVQSL